MGFWTGIGRVRLPPGRGSVRDRNHWTSRADSTTCTLNMLTEMRDFLQWREGDGIDSRRSQCSSGREQAVLRPRRRAHAHDVQLLRQSASILCARLHLTRARSAKPSMQPRTFPRHAQWGSFLRNHDELDLGRLTPDQRNLVYQRFGPEERMQLYKRGIRRRLAPMLGNRAQIEMAYSMLFSLPGTPVLRYGDEIGMGDDLGV